MWTVLLPKADFGSEYWMEGGAGMGEEGQRQGQFAPSKQAPGSPLSSDAAHQSRGPRASEGDSRQGRVTSLEQVLDTYFWGVSRLDQIVIPV